MKIAILTCSDFSVLGGAERFTLDLAYALDADVIAMGVDNSITEVYNQHVNIISLNKKLPEEPLKQIVGMKIFSKLKLDYDFYITMDDMSLHFLNKNIPHLYYMLTPRRAFYDMYYQTVDSLPLIKKIVYVIGLGIFRTYDRYFVNKNIENIVCISHNVRNRIFKIYNKNAPVIYPPTRLENYRYLPHENFWLSVGRIDKWKRIELQVDAFRKMPDKQLVIVGKIYPQYENYVEYLPDNIHVIEKLSEIGLRELYSKCTGFITTAIDEDFGITPVEALASGKPTVATKEGGYLETVLDGYTGILVSPDVDEIIKAVKEVSKEPEKYKDACKSHAQMFGYSNFKHKIYNEVYKRVNK